MESTIATLDFPEITATSQLLADGNGHTVIVELPGSLGTITLQKVIKTGDEVSNDSETETVLDPVDRRAWQGLGESLKASGHVRRLALKWQ